MQNVIPRRQKEPKWTAGLRNLRRQQVKMERRIATSDARRPKLDDGLRLWTPWDAFGDHWDASERLGTPIDGGKRDTHFTIYVYFTFPPAF